jgi:lysophospholipase L1-like esterase
MKTLLASVTALGTLLSIFQDRSIDLNIPSPHTPVKFSVPYGSVYFNNSWSNTNDFITNGNSTATLSGNYINISCTNAYDWNNTVHITPGRTKLEKWRFRLRFKLLSWTANSYGLGIGLKSANEYVQNDVFGFLQTSNTGIGGLYIVRSNQQVLKTGTTPLGVALNDVIDLEGIFYDSIFTFTARNLNSGNVSSVSFTYASNGSTAVVPNTSYFSLLELGGIHQIQSIDISSEEKTGVNIVTIGDSKTIGYFTNNFGGRYAAKLNNNYPDVVINAGGGDRITHVLSRRNELERLAGNKYLLSIGSNDLRFGGSLATLQYQYDSLVRILQSIGASVYHIVLPEDYTKSGTVNMLAFKDWVAATYPANYINVWDSLAVGNILKGIYDTGDGIHLNQAANNKIYEAIVASNKLGGGPTLPINLLRFELNNDKEGNVRLDWQTDPFDEVHHFSILRSTDGRNFDSIGKVNPNQTGQYSFSDNAAVGQGFYKLRVTETDGSVFYSRILLAKNKSATVEIIGWSQNGIAEGMVKLNAAKSCRITWSITDAVGRVHKHGVEDLGQGYNTIRVPVKPFFKGLLYFSLFEEQGQKLETIQLLIK